MAAIKKDFSPSSGTAQRSGQKGVILFIALVVLVAMSLAGVAMVRSVDTNTLASGNMAFKQASIQAADVGIRTAYAWLQARVVLVQLDNSDAANGYYASVPPDLKFWTNPANWQIGVNAACAVPLCPPDEAGNVVSYVIHRMCTVANTPYNAGVNVCGINKAPGSVGDGDSMANGGEEAFQSNPVLYYRITARVVGPHNTITVVQSMVRLPIS
jgi:type IV pilus assembly protein PilX